jgi:chemotaxis signal transduction protein
MEGPIDPQHPGQDAGAPQPEAQDDLHALLERLLGQGDVRPSALGAGDDLWPDLLAAPAADEVSTIVPAPDAPTAVADLAYVDLADAGAPIAASEALAPARPWEPVVVDTASATTNVDDIHAAILASVSVELQPIEPAVPAAAVPTEPPAAEPAPDVEPAEPELLHHAAVEPASPADVVAYDVEPTVLHAVADVAPMDVFAAETLAETLAETEALDAPALDATAPADPAERFETEQVEPAAAVADEPGAAFVLTPFEATELDGTTDQHPDADALWAAAVPQLGLDVAPLLDLDTVDVDPADEPGPVRAVVLPWPSHELTAEPAAPTPHDLIEAALAGLNADLTAEPVEPLRTPDVAVATAHVVFRLGSRTMAIPLAAVSEIARPPKVTRLPHVPAWVLGIANLRGDIVSMLDLEGFFSGKAGKSSHEQRMLALRPAGDEVRTAVLVDGVDGIQAFEDARIARVTRGYDAEVAPYARGLYQLEDDLVVIVDADRLLQSKPMRQFEDGAGAR